MEAFLVKLGLQVVLTFFQKHPWAILPTLVAAALPFILVASMFSAAASGISGGLSINYKTCTSAYKDGVDSVFKDVKGDKNADLAKSNMTGDCAQTSEDSASGYMYDQTIWQQVVDKAQGYMDDQSPYDTDKINELLNLALSGTGNGLSDEEKQYYQDQVRTEFKKFMKQDKNSTDIYKDIRDYAQGIVDISSVGYASGDAQAMIAAARTRIGMPYVLGGTWTPSKQGYLGTSFADGSQDYGFDCARLVGWALAKATGVNTNGAEPPAPYGRANVDIQYSALLRQGATLVSDTSAQPGDFLYLDGDLDGTWSHVTLYTGLNHAGQRMFIEAATGHTNHVVERTAWWGSLRHQYVRVLKGTSSSNPKAYAASQMSKNGWGANTQTNQQFICLDNLWTKESNWNPTIQGSLTRVTYNGALIPARAYGIPQSLPGEKMGVVADGGGPDWRTNPQTQINWGLHYIKDRYGSPCAAWQNSVANNSY